MKILHIDIDYFLVYYICSVDFVLSLKEEGLNNVEPRESSGCCWVDGYTVFPSFEGLYCVADRDRPVKTLQKITRRRR